MHYWVFAKKREIANIERKELDVAWIGLERKGEDWGWIGTSEFLSEELNKWWYTGEPSGRFNCGHIYGPNAVVENGHFATSFVPSPLLFSFFCFACIRRHVRIADCFSAFRYAVCNEGTRLTETDMKP